jgi:hypothetical protein
MILFVKRNKKKIFPLLGFFEEIENTVKLKETINKKINKTNNSLKTTIQNSLLYRQREFGKR